MLRRGLVDSRSEAQHAIDEGRVRVGGVAIPKAASMIEPGTPIDIRSGGSDRFVSRGGLKLEAALEAFGIDPSGRHCLDAGASAAVRSGNGQNPVIGPGFCLSISVGSHAYSLKWSHPVEVIVFMFPSGRANSIWPESVISPMA